MIKTKVQCFVNEKVPVVSKISQNVPFGKHFEKLPFLRIKKLQTERFYFKIIVIFNFLAVSSALKCKL